MELQFELWNASNKTSGCSKRLLDGIGSQGNLHATHWTQTFLSTADVPPAPAAVNAAAATHGSRDDASEYSVPVPTVFVGKCYIPLYAGR